MTTEEVLAGLIELTIREPERVSFETQTFGPVLRLRVRWIDVTNDEEQLLRQMLSRTPVGIHRYPTRLFGIGDLPLAPESRSE